VPEKEKMRSPGQFSFAGGGEERVARGGTRREGPQGVKKKGMQKTISCRGEMTMGKNEEKRSESRGKKGYDEDSGEEEGS